MRVLVTGATGFVGGRLVPALGDAGHEVTVLVRDADRYDPPDGVRVVEGDLLDPSSYAAALDVEATYYLVHSMTARDDFETRDRRAASGFARTASDAGVERVIYLGGLGEERDGLSTHLRSRREVERVLATGAYALTTLRAAVGGGVLDAPETAGETFEIGGPEVLTYAEMLRRTGRHLGHEPIIVAVPVLTPRLSAYWVGLMTDVPWRVARPLIAGLKNPVVVHDDRLREVVPVDPTPFDGAVRRALAGEEGSRADAAPA